MQGTDYGYYMIQTWACLEPECKFRGNRSGGHPQARAHRNKTGYSVIVDQHFQYLYDKKEAK